VDDALPPLAELLSLDADAFLERFRGRPIMRAKRDGLLRNACIALGNVGSADDYAALESALNDEGLLVRGHAAWAVARLAERRVVAAPEAAAALEKRSRVEHDPYVLDEIAAALKMLAQGDAS
jgi:epoxyqueuosine reductase